jgi:protein-S-isoprenylcysteine O-methyltransferase Ste14
MPLREELQRSGDWLFRWRSYLPLVLLVAVLAQMTRYTFPAGGQLGDRLWEALCFVISGLGLAVRVVAVGSAPAGTSGRNTREGQVASTVNTTGLYSLVRHPLYLGNFLMYLGIALLPRSGWLALVFVLTFWLYYERIMLAEEEFLRGRFGATYERWAAETPAFVPRLREVRTRWRPAALPFSARNALRREYSGLFALVVCFAALDGVGESVVYGRAHVDPVWLVVLGLGTVVYLTLRSLKRHTRVLDVEGR